VENRLSPSFSRSTDADLSFTFCPIGEFENTLPEIAYCSFQEVLSIKQENAGEREWGGQ
jgi:hypothetical protein